MGRNRPNTTEYALKRSKLPFKKPTEVGPDSIFHFDLGRASPRLPVYIKKMKKLYGPNPLHLDTLYTSRKPLRHLSATRVPSREEPGSAHEQTCKISRVNLPHPLKQRQDELRKRNFFVSAPLVKAPHFCRLLC